MSENFNIYRNKKNKISGFDRETIYKEKERYKRQIKYFKEECRNIVIKNECRVIKPLYKEIEPETKTNGLINAITETIKSIITMIFNFIKIILILIISMIILALIFSSVKEPEKSNVSQKIQTEKPATVQITPEETPTVNFNPEDEEPRIYRYAGGVVRQPKVTSVKSEKQLEKERLKRLKQYEKADRKAEKAKLKAEKKEQKQEQKELKRELKERKKLEKQLKKQEKKKKKNEEKE